MSEISVKLSGDNSQFRSVMANSAEEGAKYLGKLSKTFGDKVVGMRDLSTAVATALGFSVEKIATNIAGLVTGMSDEQAQALQRISDLQQQVADQAIAAARARLPIEQQLKLAVEDQAAAHKKVGEAVEKENALLKMTPSFMDAVRDPLSALATLYARREALTDTTLEHERLLKREVQANSQAEQLRSEEKKRQVELSNQLAAYDKNEREHGMAQLKLEDQRAILEQNVADARSRVNKEGITAEESAKRLLELQKAAFALDEFDLKQKQAAQLSEKQRLEQNLLLGEAKKKLTEGEQIANESIARSLASQDTWHTNLTGKQENELAILRLQSKELENQNKIKNILGDGTREISAEDQHTLLKLVDQNAELDKQIQKLQLVAGGEGNAADQAERRANAEKKITAEQQKQLDALNSANGGVFSFMQKPLTHEDLAQTSDEALQELIKRATREAATLDPTNANFNNQYLNAGSVASGFFTEGLNQSYLLNLASSARQELALRQGIRSGAINVSIFKGDPLYFDRIAQSITATDKTQQNISDQLSKLNQNIASIQSGLGNAFNIAPPRT